MTSEELIRGCIKQEHKAQKELYKLFYVELMGFCMRMSTNYEEAISLFQDGFIRIYKDIRSEKINTNLNKWIKLKMVYNTVELLRSNIHQHVISSTGRGAEQSNTELNDFSFVEKLTEEQLLKAVQKLPITYRILINLTHIDKLPSQEVAKLIDMSEGTLFSNISKAEFLLKNIIAQYYFKPQNESAAS